ncbi:hypothetical protein BDV26DRAFT_251294 [Aspergillus bertholletiae]|uniref:Six-hairpin glycosidase-like protein n=1 Tax=Aspergillus bertholletiae TaxID=1226010 RepID=A0A5N7BP45_9EURO|nr:hypothetical protein BDV26DRAFT_251294 [Aspergillus bertholletiae]
MPITGGHHDFTTNSRGVFSQLSSQTERRSKPFPGCNVVSCSFPARMVGHSHYPTVFIRPHNSPVYLSIRRIMLGASPNVATCLERFQEAQESVYGDLHSIINPQDWTPPQQSGGHRGRYLWTDAFGVINFIALHREHAKARASSASASAPDDRYLTLARRLVETVHDVLGRTRDGQDRLPGATDDNPMGGGLRIGKIDEYGLDGDGQYHHYLTIWMFALNRLSLATGDPTYNRQAIALAKAIHPHFFIGRHLARPRMVWKMSMDLSTALVASEGNLDPVDGYVTFRLLQAAAMQMGEGEVLADEIADYKKVIGRKGKHFVTKDPLDLGMSLWTAHWFAEKEDWATELSGQCFEQIYELFEVDRCLDRSNKHRLAFREFGTCMGIKCMSEQMSEKESAVDLKVYADKILDSWNIYMQNSLTTKVTPDDLRPITRVMYASALIPGAFARGYLGPEPMASPEK